MTDSTGAVLPGVTVRGIHEATGNAFEAVTDDRGAYRLPVRTGVLRITAVLQGFNTPTRNVELLVGQTAVVNLQMSPTGVAESITVTGEAPLIETTTSALGSNIDPRQVGAAGERAQLDLAGDARAGQPSGPRRHYQRKLGESAPGQKQQ